MGFWGKLDSEYLELLECLFPETDGNVAASPAWRCISGDAATACIGCGAVCARDSTVYFHDEHGAYHVDCLERERV